MRSAGASEGRWQMDLSTGHATLLFSVAFNAACAFTTFDSAIADHHQIFGPRQSRRAVSIRHRRQAL